MARATSSGGDGRRRLGNRGEDAAAGFLARHGYSIVERNYRCRLGEIDLVVTDGTTIVFVEVKLRYDRFAAYEAVHPRKQERISRAAFDFLERRGMLARPARFDVVAVDGATLECSHTPDAFDCTFGY